MESIFLPICFPLKLHQIFCHTQHWSSVLFIKFSASVSEHLPILPILSTVTFYREEYSTLLSHKKATWLDTLYYDLLVIDDLPSCLSSLCSLQLWNRSALECCCRERGGWFLQTPFLCSEQHNVWVICCYIGVITKWCYNYSAVSWQERLQKPISASTHPTHLSSSTKKMDL